MRLTKVWVNTMIKLGILVQLEKIMEIDYIYEIDQAIKFVSQRSSVEYHFNSKFVLNKLSAHLYREIDISFFYPYSCPFQAKYQGITTIVQEVTSFIKEITTIY